MDSICKALYNIGLDLSCDTFSGMCLCPDVYSFELLCYKCSLLTKENNIGNMKKKWQPVMKVENGICVFSSPQQL